MVDQSIEHCWQTFYDFQQQPQTNQKKEILRKKTPEEEAAEQEFLSLFYQN
ncbi:MAG: hypothetical protein K2H89_04910 [Oscillospiraceae bacterium]|nr:hypothetical protein [Oscillospiraceae bacterium]